MRKLKLLINFLILVTTTPLLANPHFALPTSIPETTRDVNWVCPKTYNEIVQMLWDLESGELERRYPLSELEKINAYIIALAREGILPYDFEEESRLDEDIYDLIHGKDNATQLIHDLEYSQGYTFVPAVIWGETGYDLVQCGKVSRAWKKTKKFCKKHKTSLIIGGVIVIAVAGVTVAVIASGSSSALSSAAGAIAAAGAAIAEPESESPYGEESNRDSPQESIPSDETPSFTCAIEEEVASFKESLYRENFFETPVDGEGLSLEETGRVIGPIFAHESFNHLNDYLFHSPQFSEEVQSIAAHCDFSIPYWEGGNPVDFAHNEIDRRFESDIGSMFSNPTHEVNIHALSYQMRGDAARAYGYYDQSVSDYSQAIDINPTDPTPYLKRSASYFEMGEYEKSVADFNEFAAQTESIPEKIPFSTPEFTLGFAKGVPKGVYESGKGTMLFLGELVTHPVHTATQMYDALSTLAKMAREDEWEAIGEVLSPEIHQLVTQWDTLPSDKRGELAGYAFGKHGADIAAPGAIAKIASKSVKSARELAAVLKNLQRAEGTLVLETAAGVGNTAKVGEIVSAGKKTAFLGEELGFSAKEMGQLKQAGKLEASITQTYEHLNLSMQESVKLFKNAGQVLKKHQGIYMPETKIREVIHSTGIPTFPKPKGIPKEYRVKLSKKPGGMKYVHPQDEGTYVRVMPGKPHSKNLKQQKPYVNHRINGQSVDIHGKIVPNNSEKAHISLEEFTYRNM